MTPDRWPQNVAGRFYVDRQCADCDLCREIAPECFRRHEAGGYSYVYQQPQTPEQEGRCREATDGCPMSAVHDDGPAVSTQPC